MGLESDSHGGQGAQCMYVATPKVVVFVELTILTHTNWPLPTCGRTYSCRQLATIANLVPIPQHPGQKDQPKLGPSSGHCFRGDIQDNIYIYIYISK